MDIACPRCGGLAEPAGHEDARAYFQCAACDRVWTTALSATRQAPAGSGAPPRRVLVADDCPVMLGLLNAWLEDEGWVVIMASTGREALDAAVAYRPDAAVIDIVLPPPGGFQLCEILTSRLGPPVVLMTGASHPDLLRAAEAGSVCLLQKPFTREAFMAALQRALGRRGTGEGVAAAG